MAKGDVPREPAPGGGPDDAVLVARVRAGGDRHAFETLVRRHQSAVRGLLRRLTRGDAALADDLAQEAFLTAYRKLDQFRGEARFSTWLYRVVYNSFLMHARGARPEIALDALPEAPEDAGDAALVALRQSQLSSDMQRALARLSRAEKAAIVQCYYLDRSHDEAAYVLGCPVGTVKSHVFRAKAKLRTLLSAWAPQE